MTWVIRPGDVVRVSKPDESYASAMLICCDELVVTRIEYEKIFVVAAIGSELPGFLKGREVFVYFEELTLVKAVV